MEIMAAAGLPGRAKTGIPPRMAKGSGFPGFRWTMSSDPCPEAEFDELAVHHVVEILKQSRWMRYTKNAQRYATMLILVKATGGDMEDT
jgi:hypothetical protein